MKSLKIKLGKPIDSYRIAFFRMLFGIVLFFQAFYFYSIDFIEKDVLAPVMHFPYPFLPYLKVLDPSIMYALLFSMFISSIALIMGFRSRIFSLIYLLSFSYLWLLDKGYFNNHYYLFSLLLLLFCFIRSDGHFSISTKKSVKNVAWELKLLQFQIAIVFVYAGLNKVNYWWLIEHEPVHHILKAKAIQNSNELWDSLLLEYIMVWGGMLFDLFIIPLLVWKRSQKSAIILFFLFNGLNTWIFYDIGEIGIFPLLMIATLVLFIDEKRLHSFIRKLKFELNPKKETQELNAFKPLNKFSYLLLLLYVAAQLLIPLRHHLYKGNVDYTGEGQRFSWRMKSVYKDFSIAFILKDELRDISATLDPRSVLTVKQYTNLGYYPELILPVAQNLRETAIRKGVNDPKIYVDYKVGFMGMPMKEIVDPNQELTGLDYSVFKHSEWILPLEDE